MKIVYDGSDNQVHVLGVGFVKRGVPTDVSDAMGAHLITKGNFLGVKPEDKQ